MNDGSERAFGAISIKEVGRSEPAEQVQLKVNPDWG